MSKTDMSNQELRRIAEEATAGWQNRHGETLLRGCAQHGLSIAFVNSADGTQLDREARANARFIATFDPSFVLSLLDRVERQEEALRLLVADVADYPAWQRPCHALDAARAALLKAQPLAGEGEKGASGADSGAGSASHDAARTSHSQSEGGA